MTLCLDVGSTQIFGGIFKNGEILFRFRRHSDRSMTVDELGLFLKGILKEKGIDPSSISAIAFCSVVPELNQNITECIRDYFKLEPFILQAGVKCGLKVRYSNPHELGSDLIANAVAATAEYPGQNLIIVDFGAATSFCAVSSEKEYLGGALIPGMSITMEALAQRTAKLPAVEIIKTFRVCCKSTAEGIQSGLYFGTLGMIKELTGRLIGECFSDGKAIVIATGTYAELYTDSGIFDAFRPDLVLEGVYNAYLLNREKKERKKK